MLHGFWKLAWVETKVFVREPMGVIGSLLLPVILFAALGRVMWRGEVDAAYLEQAPFNVTILAALTIAVGAVLSLVAIMAIYRESGILKRLRATPLSPVTILGAHVVVKLAFTVISLGLLVVAGRRILPGAIDVNLVSFTAALLLGTLSILSTGFVIASLVPTARFAQPIGAALFYPMIGLSGLFFPLDRMPGGLRVVAYCLPTTHAVALMQGVWDGTPWSALWLHVAALAIIMAMATALAAWVFRWE
jgi:ABC-2 type transport system permease protein